ncbi:hypothetical protein KIN20_001275 [Parelaphostrongylus tenuis]|uniref:Uncharacterized protein n=1 Tax=Parelaphostrongylus tenuis TaxID=148309 RepID=A0AAD5LTV9_PARTN|nr:hypothetical protein KIN20_001275 [Parelaphostrongylus tenuis]
MEMSRTTLHELVLSIYLLLQKVPDHLHNLSHLRDPEVFTSIAKHKCSDHKIRRTDGLQKNASALLEDYPNDGRTYLWANVNCLLLK